MPDPVVLRQSSEGWFVEHNGSQFGPFPQPQAESRAEGLALKFGTEIEVEERLTATDGGEI